GLGMTVVLLALTVAIALARTWTVRRRRQARPHVRRISGGLVTLAGAYVAWYGWQSRGLGEGRVSDSNVTRVVSDWSTSVTSWIDSVGAVRITVVVAILLAGVLVGVRATRDAGDAHADQDAGQQDGDDDLDAPGAHAVGQRGQIGEAH